MFLLVLKNRCWPIVVREARLKLTRSEVYKFAARAAHNHDNNTIKFDLSLRHFKWTCPQIDHRLLNQNELWKSVRSLFLAKWVYNLVAREARAQCVNCVLVLASWKLAALIFTCIYPMVSAMKSYNGLTSRRISVSRQRSTKSDFESPSMTNGIHEELWFHRLQNNVYYRWISSHFSCKQNSKHKNAELSILAGEDLTPKNPLERERRLEIQRHNQQRWRRHQQTAEQREHHTMNFEC